MMVLEVVYVSMYQPNMARAFDKLSMDVFSILEIPPHFFFAILFLDPAAAGGEFRTSLQKCPPCLIMNGC